MAKSPAIQMQNWFMHNQQWFCAPLGNNDQFWLEYTEALQDATGIFLCQYFEGLFMYA